ncbi:MAG: hypothetical protein GYB64_06070 [Chloroflexi bacterium]|nr:hypothetical protein [Chloroflexota bacterium]
MFSGDRQYIVPQYKLILSYDIQPGSRERYYQYVMSELVPALQEEGLYMTEAWHTAFGEYPIRLIIFAAEDYDTIEMVLASEKWQMMEDEFQRFIRNYTKLVVPYRQGFQFITG